MADDLDLKAMRLEIQELRAEIAMPDKQKFPKGRYKMFALVLLYALLVPMIVQFWCPMLGITQHPNSNFSSVTVDGPVHAAKISISDDVVKSTGEIRADRPLISLDSNDERAIFIDSDSIALSSERGTLSIEISEKGEPVMRYRLKQKK